MENKHLPQYLYNPNQIRTSNMLPDRSTDLAFDPEYTPDDGVSFPEASQTQQAFLKECDINYIVAQNEKTGFISHTNRGQPVWGDFGTGLDYQQSLNYINEAQQNFMSLDAGLRARFNNDPAQFLDFVNDPKNASELINMGLATDATPKAPEKAPEPVKKQKKSEPEDSE